MHTTKIVLAASVLSGNFDVVWRIGAGRKLDWTMAMRGDVSDPPGGIAFITQYGPDLNVLAGVPSRAWIDYPGHIWFEIGHQGAIYSPDGLTLQFDSGTVWQRAPEVPPPPLFEVLSDRKGPGQAARRTRRQLRRNEDLVQADEGIQR